MSGWANRSRYNINKGDNKHHQNGSESGILRKAPQVPPHVVEQQHLDDLLVFGYACKIFRDDSRATQIDHGKHLIPWMGDASLKIDRYDVRATMSDIAPYEAPAGGFTDQLATLTLAEQRAEKMCEEERYHSLYNNDVEEEMYKDETLKRLHRERSSTYGQVAFDYNNAAGSTGTVTRTDIPEKLAKDPDDDPFAVNPRFYVPPNIELPDSMKLHAVIEKTAKFIAAQGPQMEILIKAKQSNNPQFEFLNQTNVLNPYYKHVLNAVKNGYYPAEDPEPSADSHADDLSAAQQDGTSTQPTVSAPQPVIVPQIKYKPSADCAYTQLISKIKGVPMPDDADGTGSPSESNESARDSPDAFSREATLKHIKDFQLFQKNNQSTTVNDAGRQAGHKSNGPLLASPMPVGNGSSTSAKPATTKEKATVEVKKISGALLLAQCYNSDTEEENDDDEAGSKPAVNSLAKPVDLPPPIETKMPFDIPIPPAELQNIIDKTAAYVLKNGKEFEEILRTKNDQRFSFLMYTDQYNRYYVYKVTGAICSGPVVVAEAPKEPPKSVSFSIKPKEETSSLPLRPVLPQEQSSDEEETPEKTTKSVVIATTPPIATICPATSTSGGLLPTPSPKVLLPTPILGSATQTMPMCQDIVAKPTAISTKQRETTGDLNLSEASLRDALLDADDNHQTVTVAPTVEQRSNDTKRADALKDRLAQAARDKMGAMSREKQLQLERRKKAMAFLIQMKTNTATSASTTPVGVAPPMPVAPITPISDEVVVVVDCPENHSSDNAVDVGGVDCADDNGSVHSVHSVHSSPARSPVIVLNGGIVSDDDPDDNADAKSTDSEHSRRRTSSRKRSRSPSASSSRRHKHKKSKHHRQHSKKKSSGRRSRSRSSSLARRDERRSGSRGTESRRHRSGTSSTPSTSYRSSRHKSSRHRNS